jgi:hypothetical protein
MGTFDSTWSIDLTEGPPVERAAPAIFGPGVLAESAANDGPGVLQVTLADDGRLTVRGPRVALVEFLACCARHGFFIELDYLNWCG